MPLFLAPRIGRRCGNAFYYPSGSETNGQQRARDAAPRHSFVIATLRHKKGMEEPPWWGPVIICVEFGRPVARQMANGRQGTGREWYPLGCCQLEEEWARKPGASCPDVLGKRSDDKTHANIYTKSEREPWIGRCHSLQTVPQSLCIPLQFLRSRSLPLRATGSLPNSLYFLPGTRANWANTGAHVRRRGRRPRAENGSVAFHRSGSLGRA